MITGSSTVLGTVSLAAGGVANLAWGSFATGAHNLVASFSPSNSAVNAASTSSALLFTATAPAVAPASQGIDVTIPAGALTISTPYSSLSPFQLGTATLNPATGVFTASAPFGSLSDPSQGVTITDTRAGAQPWSAAATVTSFSDSSSDSFSGQNLTFTGVTPSYISGNALQGGSVIPTNLTGGLAGGPNVFATAADGFGSVYIDGTLTLTLPSSTKAGTYTATLTFTVS